MRGIHAYETYVPQSRLRRADIAAAFRQRGALGTRSVASYDEDTTTMGVEAARGALRACRESPETVLFSTTAPVYADKTNATTIRVAAGLGRHGLAADVTGSVRSTFAALDAAVQGSRSTLVVLSDTRSGLPGGADERDGGDAAAAFIITDAGDGPLLAEYIASASISDEFLDRWRTPGAAASQTWDERFGEHIYVPMAEEAIEAALKDANLAPGDVRRAGVTGVHARAVRSVARNSGFADGVVVDDLTHNLGNTGAAHPGLVLAAMLDAAEPGEILALVVLSDGVDVLLLRTTEALRTWREQWRSGVRDEVPDYITYPIFLSWRGVIERERGRRPAPAVPAAPASHRHGNWKLSLTGTECEGCGRRHLPPQRVCSACDRTDQVVDVRMADTTGTIVTFSVDWLAASPNPPSITAIVDFDGGGRIQCDLADVHHEAVAVGDRVEMTFRRLHSVDGVHNYFWKARPMRTTR